MNIVPTGPPDHPVLSLDATVLEHLDPAIAVPGYARDRLRPSIIHIGVGGFHRAHLATYIDELCRLGHRDWSIVGAGVLPGDHTMATALASQDHLYTLITRGAQTTSLAVIGSIVDYIHAVPRAQQLIAAIAARTTEIVSLTVTEGGYPVDDSTGAYRGDTAADSPMSAFDIIAAGLDLRRRTSGTPITIMSCDNVIANGTATRTATLGAAQRHGGELATWIETSATFPSSMVDRITPATTDADRSWLAADYGLADRWPVVTEPFRQWVVEDSFGGGRPPLEELDVIVTSDVEPYELMKLRLLNAGHSCLAYLAALAGFESVDTAMAEPSLRRFVTGFLDHEAKPTLPSVAGVDLDAYTASIVDRFSNPQIGDQIARLCLNGSAKFPKFLLPTVRAQLATGGPIALSALALAGWCEYLNGATEQGATINRAGDPGLEVGIGHAQRSCQDPRSFLDFSEVFGADLSAPGRFADTFVAAIDRLRTNGIRSAIDAALQEVVGTDDKSHD